MHGDDHQGKIVLNLFIFSEINWIALVNEFNGLLLIEESFDWFIPNWFVIDGHSSWLYGNWVIELLLDGVVLIFIKWLLNQCWVAKLINSGYMIYLVFVIWS